MSFCNTVVVVFQIFIIQNILTNPVLKIRSP